jgi:hypothetical protein
MPEKIRIPKSSLKSAPSLEALLSGILKHDQFDDWLADPVYFEDCARSRKPWLERITREWESGEVSSSSGELLRIPRSSGKTVPALVLPLPVRVCAHRVIATLASRIAAKIPRDKVYGFQYRPAGDPYFTLPGEGLDEAWDQAIAASRIFGPIAVLDVDSFNESIELNRLEGTLQGVGVTVEETAFLRGLMEGAGPGVPSIDDAFAFLYNYYLLPVDTALFEKKIHFMRYRDEFLLFDKDGVEFVTAQLQGLALRSRVAQQLPDFSEIKDKLQEKITPEHSEEEEDIDLGWGKILVRYSCDTWADEESCSTDRFEVRYAGEHWDSALKELFDSAVPARAIDGVNILPILRTIHQTRKDAVLWSPALTEANFSPPVRAYRKELAEGRSWLVKALRVGVEQKSDWQIVWAATLLSDIGLLNQQEVTLLKSAARNQLLRPFAQAYARLALARSSKAQVEDCWTSAERMTTGYPLRVAMLTASFLRRRGEEGPWGEIISPGREQEPELWGLLTKELNVARTIG